MAKLNHHYQKLSPLSFFSEVNRKVAMFQKKHPEKQLLDLGIGTYKGAILPIISSALTEACRDIKQQETLRGYSPNEGYFFLREAIARNEYRNCGISPEEIFISNSAHADIANLQEIFAIENRIALQDPSFPIYLDSNVMAGRTRQLLKTGGYGGVTYLPCLEQNHFQPQIPHSAADLIYLCSPNNPTGVAMDRDLLKQWVHYAKVNQAVIFFDATYASFIQSPSTPRSIYEIEGATEVAIEVRSLSKKASLGALRCSYTVIPHQLKVRDAGAIHSVHALWKRRQETKFNGVSYVDQKAAAALYTAQGQIELNQASRYLTANAQMLRQGLQEIGMEVWGGVDSPYLWCKIPNKMKSWDFFDHLLKAYQIIALPGRGFGLSGEGFMRLCCLGSKETLYLALERLKEEREKLLGTSTLAAV